MLDLLLAALWGLGGLIGALPERRFEWVLGPLAAAAWGILASRLGLRQLLVGRNAVGYVLLGATWVAVSGMALSMNSLKESILPACAAATGALFLLERRSALQGHGIVGASFVAAVIGATQDPTARMLPMFVPFLVLIVLCLALSHQQWVLQRLRRAAQEGYLLAAQVPGYAGTRTGLAPTVTVVALTTTVASIVLYLVVPHFRWKPPADKRDANSKGSQGASGMTDRLSLRAMHDLKMDHRVALRMKLTQDGRAFRPSLPMRLRGAVVDNNNGVEWWSTAASRTRVDANDGKADGWVTLIADAGNPVLQECEIEATSDQTIVALPEIAEVEANLVNVDDHGVVRIPSLGREGRVLYKVISDAAGIDPATFDEKPRSPNPRYLQILGRKDADIVAVARDVTYGAATAARKAALIEHWLQTNFEYSTEFDPSGESDPVRALLFIEKRGYCVHFAAAMAVMLRTLDIPCRIAQGLYGGEWSDREQLSMFRFSDAHAWVEVWLGPRAGWVPFDPTPRLRSGEGEEENPEDFAGGGPEGERPPPPPREAKKPASSFSTEPLTALNLERQAQWLRWLRRLFANAWNSTFGRGVACFIAFSFSLLITWNLLPRHERDRLSAVFVGGPGASTGFWNEFVTLARRGGFRSGPGETPFEFAKRVERTYPGAGRVALALYAVKFGGKDAREKTAEARPVLDAIRRAQAGKPASVDGPETTGTN
ncbi:MAG: transglutaminaseTgpA domain-containing protein [Planctomycetota bacterium]